MKNFIKLFAVSLFLGGLISCSENQNPPILILTGNSVFGTYTGEILKAEGFNAYHLDSITDKKIRLKYLRNFDLVILTTTELSHSQQKMITGYVETGGHLIVFRPDAELSEIFGIKESGGTINEGYIQISDSLDIGRGMIGNSLQLHTPAEQYILQDGRQIASLLVDSVRYSGSPAVIYNEYGRGKSIAFTYDLPENIVYTRQGDPRLAGIERDGINGLRAMDMFTDGWLKSSNNTINQADEQMRLLTHCIEIMSSYKKPLPRFWYFPDSLKCIVTLTNDGEYRNEEHFGIQYRDIDSMGAKMTIYILEVDKVSKGFADYWTARGHEISGHPDDVKEASNPTWRGMNHAIKTKKAEIADKYGLPMNTIVNHWFVWCGRDSAGNQEFAAQAQIEASHAIGMDINYAHYDMNSSQGHFLGPMGTDQGNFTGSGLVMKFADCRGNILNIYQHLNNVYDQLYNENKDPEGFFNCFKGLMDRSLYNEVYSAISIKAHNDEYYFSKEPLSRMISYAKEKGIPVWTAAKLLDFIRMKDEATFSNISWKENQLSFRLNSSIKHSHGLSFMVPAAFGDLKISSIIRDGEELPFFIRSLKGYDYASVIVTPGNNYNFKVSYNN